MVVGIKVDKGVVPLAGTNGETTTQGENPMIIYLVVKITHGIFLSFCIHLNWNFMDFD